MKDADFLHPVSKKGHRRLGAALSISSISSGSPFTVYSRNSADRRRQQRRRPPRPDRQAASLHRPQGPRRTTSARAQTTARLLSPFPFMLPAAQAPTRAALAPWAATPSAARPSTTSTSRSSKTRPSAAARAELNASICSSARSSSTCSTLSPWACRPTSSTAPALARSAKPPATPGRSSSRSS